MAILSDMISEIRSFFGAMKDVDPEGDVAKLQGIVKQKEQSIKSKAKNSIMKFPLLVSTSLRKESVAMISKALEVEYANLIRLAISIDDLVDAGDLKNGPSKVKYIQKFHKNITPGNEIDDLGMMESAIDSVIKKESKLLTNDLNKKSINSMTISNDYSSQIFFEDKNPPMPNLGFKPNKPSPVDNPKSNDAEQQSGVTVRLSDQDIKKANDMSPTLLDLTLQYKTEGKLTETKLLIGIKTVAHPISGSEMEYYISRTLKEENFFFRVIQWTTGEISFFKDFLLNIDRLKDEAQANTSLSSPWWHKLRGMANASLMLSFFQRTKLIPTTTLVLSMEEVDRLKYNQGIDLMNKGQANKLSKIYFLLGLVIIDEVDEVVYTFDEETKTYATHSFAALSKESKDSSSLKAILSMFGKQ